MYVYLGVCPWVWRGQVWGQALPDPIELDIKTCNLITNQIGGRIRQVGPTSVGGISCRWWHRGEDGEDLAKICRDLTRYDEVSQDLAR